MMEEKKLIDRNKLIAYFEGQCDIAKSDPEKESVYVLAALKCCIDLFQNFPTVDAVEVVHGKIIETIENGKMKRVFSCCNTDCARIIMRTAPNYCPNCGAKLDIPFRLKNAPSAEEGPETITLTVDTLPGPMVSDGKGGYVVL